MPYAARLVTCDAAVVGKVASADAARGELMVRVEAAIRGEVKPGLLAIRVQPAEHAKSLNKPEVPVAVFLRRTKDGEGWQLGQYAAEPDGNHGDPLAGFIVLEIRETHDPSKTDAEQLEAARRGVDPLTSLGVD